METWIGHVQVKISVLQQKRLLLVSGEEWPKMGEAGRALETRR